MSSDLPGRVASCDKDGCGAPNTHEDATGYWCEDHRCDWSLPGRRTTRPTHSLDSRCTVQGCPECDHAPSARERGTTACRHCGKPPEPDGDHSCACPYSDDACPDHPLSERTRLIREQQRDTTGEVTAVMVSGDTEPGRTATPEYLPCCGCCGEPCQFNGEPDKHASLCPVCEVECPCCGDSHPPTKAFVVRNGDCDAR